MATQSISRGVVKKVYAAETPEGAGAIVRRSIGSMSLRNLSPFLMCVFQVRLQEPHLLKCILLGLITSSKLCSMLARDFTHLCLAV
jgi:hypothetical protein